MRKTYRARPGTKFKDRDAKVIGKFLDETFPDGQYTPADIVKKARNPASPIHKYFQWDQRKAAHLYNISQARKLVQAVVVVIENDGVHYDTPVAVSIQTTAGRSYFDIGKVDQIPHGWEMVLQEALQGLHAWKTRYQYLKGCKELGPVFAAIEKLKRSHKNGKKSSKTKQRTKPERRENRYTTHPS